MALLEVGSDPKIHFCFGLYRIRRLRYVTWSSIQSIDRNIGRRVDGCSRWHCGFRCVTSTRNMEEGGKSGGGYQGSDQKVVAFEDF